MLESFAAEKFSKLELQKIKKTEEFPDFFRETKEGMPENDSADLKELTYDEKVEKQDKEIASVENGDKPLDPDNKQELGNYGEMKVDQDLREKGYERISTDMVTDIDQKGHTGIDGVYYNPDGHPPYLIVESKYGSSQLNETADGKQMSERWIDNRLENAVGKEMADKMRQEEPENIGKYLAHTDKDGNVTYGRLDDNADIIGKDVKFN